MRGLGQTEQPAGWAPASAAAGTLRPRRAALSAQPTGGSKVRMVEHRRLTLAIAAPTNVVAVRCSVDGLRRGGQIRGRCNSHYNKGTSLTVRYTRVCAVRGNTFEAMGPGGGSRDA